MRQFDEQWFQTWFGDAWEADAATRALSTLDDQFRRAFGTPLYKSPGLTGALCWRKTTGRQWEPLPVETQQLIRGTTGQGRFELCPVPGLTELPALHCLDLRLAYAASAVSATSGRQWERQERPANGWIHEVQTTAVPGFLDFTPARYRVQFGIPKGWAHVGILPVHCDGWEWPACPTITMPWETWADAAEVRLAIANGWKVEILERLICVDSDIRSERRPLRRWAEKLLALRDTLTQGAEEPELYRTAIRNVILQGVGVFAARPKIETRTVETREELPTHDLAEESYREREDGSIEFDDYVSSPAMNGMAHPEFAAAVWADTRVRLLRQRSVVTHPMAAPGAPQLTGALQLPREQVIGFGLDCIYATGDPQWHDDGKPGRFRVKWSVPGPIPVPTNRRELETMAPGG